MALLWFAAIGCDRGSEPENGSQHPQAAGDRQSDDEESAQDDDEQVAGEDEEESTADDDGESAADGNGDTDDVRRIPVAEDGEGDHCPELKEYGDPEAENWWSMHTPYGARTIRFGEVDAYAIPDPNERDHADPDDSEPWMLKVHYPLVTDSTGGTSRPVAALRLTAWDVAPDDPEALEEAEFSVDLELRSPSVDCLAFPTLAMFADTDGRTTGDWTDVEVNSYEPPTEQGGGELAMQFSIDVGESDDWGYAGAVEVDEFAAGQFEQVEGDFVPGDRDEPREVENAVATYSPGQRYLELHLNVQGMGFRGRGIGWVNLQVYDWDESVSQVRGPYRFGEPIPGMPERENINEPPAAAVEIDDDRLTSFRACLDCGLESGDRPEELSDFDDEVEIDDIPLVQSGDAAPLDLEDADRSDSPPPTAAEDIEFEPCPVERTVEVVAGDDNENDSVEFAFRHGEVFRGFEFGDARAWLELEDDEDEDRNQQYTPRDQLEDWLRVELPRIESPVPVSSSLRAPPRPVLRVDSFDPDQQRQDAELEMTFHFTNRPNQAGPTLIDCVAAPKTERMEGVLDIDEFRWLSDDGAGEAVLSGRFESQHDEGYANYELEFSEVPVADQRWGPMEQAVRYDQDDGSEADYGHGSVTYDADDDSLRYFLRANTDERQAYIKHMNNLQMVPDIEEWKPGVFVIRPASAGGRDGVVWAIRTFDPPEVELTRYDVPGQQAEQLELDERGSTDVEESEIEEAASRSLVVETDRAAELPAMKQIEFAEQ